MKVTEEFIKKGKTLKGGYTKKQLEILGISWPPQKGWVKKVLNKEISVEEAEEFIRYCG